MNQIILPTDYLEQQKAYAKKIHAELKKDEIRAYIQIAGVAVVAVVGTYLSIKRQKKY